MAELDLETMERTVRWCAEAGRQTTAAEVAPALASLGWDQLLSVRALLAEPPPARPLGPYALADLARGAPADVAAERERAGRYPRAQARPLPAPEAAEPPRAPGGPAARRQRGEEGTPLAGGPQEGGRHHRLHRLRRPARSSTSCSSPPAAAR